MIEAQTIAELRQKLIAYIADIYGAPVQERAAAPMSTGVMDRVIVYQIPTGFVCITCEYMPHKYRGFGWRVTEHVMSASQFIPSKSEAK